MCHGQIRASGGFVEIESPLSGWRSANTPRAIALHDLMPYSGIPITAVASKRWSENVQPRVWYAVRPAVDVEGAQRLLVHSPELCGSMTWSVDIRDASL